jgi:hypothetical protein
VIWAWPAGAPASSARPGVSPRRPCLRTLPAFVVEVSRAARFDPEPTPPPRSTEGKIFLAVLSRCCFGMLVAQDLCV